MLKLTWQIKILNEIILDKKKCVKQIYVYNSYKLIILFFSNLLK